MIKNKETMDMEYENLLELVKKVDIALDRLGEGVYQIYTQVDKSKDPYQEMRDIKALATSYHMNLIVGREFQENLKDIVKKAHTFPDDELPKVDYALDVDELMLELGWKK